MIAQYLLEYSWIFFVFMTQVLCFQDRQNGYMENDKFR